MAPAAGGTDLLRAKPVHHVTGVSSVAAAQAEVRRAAYGHVTDGALEGEALADGALGATGLTATVAAVNAKLYAFVWLWRAGDKFEHLCPLVLHAPSVQDLTVTLLEVVKLPGVGGVQQSFVHVVLFFFSFSGVGVYLVCIAIVIRRRFSPGRSML